MNNHIKTYRNFYPRSPCGERRIGRCRIQTPKYFYPRSPCGERPASLWLDWLFPEFLSTLSLRRATNVRSNGDNRSRISIHALLAESDSHRKGRPSQLCKISIHALLAESDSASLWLDWLFPEFLSTLSLRRATPSLYQLYDTYAFLSTLSLRRATFLRGLFLSEFFISIHALLAESDAARPERQRTLRHFYPRSPCGERPWPAAA